MLGLHTCQTQDSTYFGIDCSAHCEVPQPPLILAKALVVGLSRLKQGAECHGIKTRHWS